MNIKTFFFIQPDMFCALYTKTPLKSPFHYRNIAYILFDYISFFDYNSNINRTIQTFTTVNPTWFSLQQPAKSSEIPTSVMIASISAMVPSWKNLGSWILLLSIKAIVFSECCIISFFISRSLTLLVVISPSFVML